MDWFLILLHAVRVGGRRYHAEVGAPYVYKGDLFNVYVYAPMDHSEKHAKIEVLKR